MTNDTRQYLLIGYGETPLPEMIYATGRDEVRIALAKLQFDPVGEDEWAMIDEQMQGFDNPDEWNMDGCRWEFRFEIGGIEITRLTIKEVPNGSPAPDEVSGEAVSANALHAAIMNLPCRPKGVSGANQTAGYRLGFREARHVAAELALASAAHPAPAQGADGWSLVMGAAASLEDAANCMRDPDGKRAALKAAQHYRDQAQKLTATQHPTEGLPSWWSAFILNICELPDRTSPDDEPAAMIATADELESCALRAIEDASEHPGEGSKGVES